MPVGNMMVRSERLELWSKPQHNIGPGQYDTTVPDFKPQSGMAPFLCTAERRTGGETTATPGPGAYAFNTSCIKLSNRPSPQFCSRVERLESDRTRLKALDTPGPGAYCPDLVRPLAKKEAPHGNFHGASGINWLKVASAPSIPGSAQSYGYEEGSAGQLVQQNGPLSVAPTAIPGPGSYNPSLDPVKSHGRILTSFGKPKSVSKVEDPSPGPGAYDPSKFAESVTQKGGVGANRLLSTFASTTGRGRVTNPSYGDGPGAFKNRSGFHSLQEHLAGNPDTFSAFGSSAADPRPSEYKNTVPGPGTYYGGVEDGSGAAAQAKPSLAFVSTSKRFGKDTTITPGPGAYADARAVFAGELESRPRGRFGVFGSTSARFVRPREDVVPPVGQYETATSTVLPTSPVDERRRDKRTSAFRSSVTRSISAGAPDRPLCYDAKNDWPKPASTSKAFISSVPRFGRAPVEASEVPGPGAYTTDMNGPRGDPRKAPGFGKGTRFSNGLYENTPGPGSYYSGTSSLQKKTFNITIGENWS